MEGEDGGAEAETANEGGRSRRTRRPQRSYLDDQMASNNWVISGKHTSTGNPILSADPHLDTGIPAFWTIQHIEYTDTLTGET